MAIQKTVFISYRRTNMYMARAVYQDLRAHGYDAFLDMERLDSGDFSQGLLTQIAARAHFVLILTPSALERCTSPDDWVRKEIEYAIEQKRNVVPVLFEGVKFEQIRHFLASDILKLLENYSGLTVPDDFFEEAMERLRGTRYLYRDTDTVLHPVVAKSSQIAQAKADAAPAPTAEQLKAEQLFERGFHKSRLMSEYDEAIQDFSDVIELRPDYADAYHWRGRAKWNKDDNKGALEDLRIAARLDPNNRQIHLIRSAIAEIEGNSTYAMLEAEHEVLLNPHLDESYIRRGRVRADQGDYDGAIADFNEAIRLNPLHSIAYNNRALANYDKKEYVSAMADCNEAIRLNPQYAKAYYNRGKVYKKMGEFDNAIADFNEAIRINSNFVRAHNNRGMTYVAKGDLDKAIKDFEVAIQLDPNFKFAKKNLDAVRQSK